MLPILLLQLPFRSILFFLFPLLTRALTSLAHHAPETIYNRIDRHLRRYSWIAENNG